jgi:hypothetical protein
MKRNIILILLLLIGNKVYSQNIETFYNISNIELIPESFPLSLLNGYGNSGLLNDAANTGSINPAALANFDKKAVGISYQFGSKFNNPFATEIFYERVNQIIPQSIGFVYPLEDLKIGLSMRQKYNTSILIGPVPITTVNNPDGTGQTFTPVYKTTVIDYSIGASYTFPEIFKNSFLTFGFRYGLDNLREYAEFYNIGINESINSTDFAFGAMFTFKEEENKYLQFGLSYESELKFSKITKWNMDDNFPDPTAEGNQYMIDYSSPIELIAQLPSVLRFDFDISTISKIKILGSVSNIYWYPTLNYMNNQIEFTGSFVYLLNETFSPSIGFIYMDRRYDEDVIFKDINRNDLFITGGLAAKYGNMNINVALAVGNILSNQVRIQTILELNISYNF